MTANQIIKMILNNRNENKAHINHKKTCQFLKTSKLKDINN